MNWLFSLSTPLLRYLLELLHVLYCSSSFLKHLPILPLMLPVWFRKFWGSAFLLPKWIQWDKFTLISGFCILGNSLRLFCFYCCCCADSLPPFWPSGENMHLQDHSSIWSRGLQTYSVESQMADILDFSGYMVSTTTNHLSCSAKTAIDNMQTNGHFCVFIKSYL